MAEIPTTTHEAELDDERARVEGWRLHVLIEAGYPTSTAARLACRHDVDLHRAAELVEQGCPPDTAAEILL